MTHYRKTLTATLVALVLTVAPSAAIHASTGASLGTNPATTTPVNVNLLRNPGFEQLSGNGTIPKWTTTGDVHVETFGTKSWPTQAYANKWKGGSRYLACGTKSGSVSQTVSVDGLGTRSYMLLARLTSYFGGTTGHTIRVSLTFTGSGNQSAYKEKVRVLDITDHYLKAVTTYVLPLWATHITARVQLMPKAGDGRCRIVADTTVLYLFKP